MADEPNGGLSLRYVADLIERYRIETKEARHEQANRLMAALGDIEHRLDNRLRAIELDNAASAPTTLGPRVNHLEREFARLDGDIPGGAPKRINDLEAWKDRIEGGVQTLKIGMTVLVAVNVVLGIVVAVLALT